MSDNAPYDIAAATEESAKAVQEMTRLVRDFGAFVGAASGTLPQTIFGLLEDRLKYSRAERAIGYYARLKAKIEALGIGFADIRAPSPSIEVPLLEAATLEDRAELQKLWDKLLAAAVLPETRNRVRARHIEILKRLEPLDAALLQIFDRVSGQREVNTVFAFSCAAANMLGDAGQDEVTTSLFALADLRLVDSGYEPSTRTQQCAPRITPEGRNFLFVVTRE